jgi:hypothetical protein
LVVAKIENGSLADELVEKRKSLEAVVLQSSREAAQVQMEVDKTLMAKAVCGTLRPAPGFCLHFGVLASFKSRWLALLPRPWLGPASD